MTVSLKHAKIVAIPDDGSSEVGTQEWNAEHRLTAGANTLIGCDDAEGTVKEIPTTEAARAFLALDTDELIARGSGDRAVSGLHGPPRIMEIRDGGSGTPISSNASGPTLLVSRTEDIETISNDGSGSAAILGIALTSGAQQPVAVSGYAYNGSTSTADVCGLYGVGIQNSQEAAPGGGSSLCAYGGFLAFRTNAPNGSGWALQTDSYNGTGKDVPYSPVGGQVIGGLDLNYAPATGFVGGPAIQIRATGPGGGRWDVGIGFVADGGIRTASIQDDGSATHILLANSGAHANGINLTGATFSDSAFKSTGFRVDGAGRIGVGTGTSGLSAKLTLQDATGSPDGGLKIYNGVTTGSLYVNGSNQFAIGTVESSPFVLFTAATARLTLSAAGAARFHAYGAGILSTDASGNVTALTFDTDGTLAANSDTRVATQKAVKTYVDASFAANDAMVFKGVISAAANPNYPAADAGHTYRISAAGKIGGASGANVEIGDFIICLTDGTAAGTQAAVGANWSIVQSNLDGAVIGPASATSGNIATYSGITGKLIQDGGKALPSGSVVGTSDTQTLTNKTLTSPIINNILNGAATLTLPTTTDTLLGRATTDTLTNKTFDTAGAGNSLLINGVAASANTGTGAVARAVSPSFTTPTLGAATHTSLTGGTLYGGTSTSAALVLTATSGVGAGSESVTIRGGNNGGTTFATFQAAGATFSTKAVINAGSATEALKITGTASNTAISQYYNNPCFFFQQQTATAGNQLAIDFRNLGGSSAAAIVCQFSATGTPHTAGSAAADLVFMTANVAGLAAESLRILQTGQLNLTSTAHWAANGSVATTMTSLGPTGANTTIQEWLAVKNSAGVTRYIPAY